jgi:hypothetical protein
MGHLALMRIIKMNTKTLAGNPQGRKHFGDLGVIVRLVLK